MFESFPYCYLPSATGAKRACPKFITRSRAGVGRGEESGTFRPLSGCLEKRGRSPLQIARALLTQDAAGRYIRPLLRRWRGTDRVRLGYAITAGHNLSSGLPSGLPLALPSGATRDVLAGESRSYYLPALVHRRAPAPPPLGMLAPGLFPIHFRASLFGYTTSCVALYASRRRDGPPRPRSGREYAGSPI